MTAYLGQSQKDAYKLPEAVQKLFAYALEVDLKGVRKNMAKKNPKNKPEIIEFTVSSGNVYADFGIPNPEEEKTKGELAMLITEIIKEKKLTHAQVANLIDIEQPKISRIIRGILTEFSVERLLNFVLALGFDVEITPKPHKSKSTLPSMHINTKLLHSLRLRTQ